MKVDFTAIILCGGRGERLKPLTDSIPKPLIEINDKPILTYLINYLKACGLSKFIIASGYKSECISSFFKNNFTDLDIQIVDSGEVDIITRIQDCLKFIKNDFMILYGDTLADVNFNELFNFYKDKNCLGTITLYPLKSQFGLVELNQNCQITQFREKPILNQFINIGYMLFKQSVIPDFYKYDDFVSFLHHFTEQGKLFGFKHDGIHITVNTLTELEQAKNQIHFFQ